MKRALVTGIGGQDGSYLTDLLLGEGYEIFGLVRRSSTGNLRNLAHCLDRITLCQGDITDYGSLQRLVCGICPDVIYHEADQDNVDYSLENPLYSVDVTIKGVANLLEIVQDYESVSGTVRVFIPCSSTMFAETKTRQDEDTPFNPQSPYAVGKVAAYHLANYYRQVHNMFVTTAILYNHDSVRRCGNYLLHKICKAAVTCSKNLSHRKIKFWDLSEEVAIGQAPNFVDGIYRIMQLPYASNFVIGSDELWKVKDLLEMAFKLVDLEYPDWIVEGPKQRPGNQFRLIPDYSKILQATGWRPAIGTAQLIEDLVKRYQQELP